MVDLTDPCARAQYLWSAYYGALSGTAETLIRSRGPDSEEEVRYNASKMDIGALRRAAWEAEDECREQQGLPPLRRRFAIAAGSRRTCVPVRD